MDRTTAANQTQEPKKARSPTALRQKGAYDQREKEAEPVVANSCTTYARDAPNRGLHLRNSLKFLPAIAEANYLIRFSEASTGLRRPF